MKKLVFAITLVLLLGIPVITGCAGSRPEAQPAQPPAPETVTVPEPQTGTVPQTGQGPQTGQQTQKELSPSERVPRITAEELLQKIEQKDNILIIDTRKGVETAFASGHIKGAVPVPSSQIIDRQWPVPENKDLEIVLYCT
jgi:hypothetical protein